MHTMMTWIQWNLKGIQNLTLILFVVVQALQVAQAPAFMLVAQQHQVPVMKNQMKNQEKKQTNLKILAFHLMLLNHSMKILL